MCFVGIGEGSFFIKNNNDGCFLAPLLKQRLHINLFEAFKLVFSTNTSGAYINNEAAEGVISLRRPPFGEK